MTKTSLAHALGVSQRSLTAYERSDTRPSETTLIRLAEVLAFPPEFFAGEDVDEPPLELASFRALTSLSAQQRDQALASGALALLLDKWIQDRFDLPNPSIPLLDTGDAEAAAVAVRTFWNIGQLSVSNMIHLVEQHGVRVYSLVQECRSLDAYSFWKAGVPYIFLNTMKSAEHSRMDCAHELGHLVLHANGPHRGRDVEQEAQLFASAFLMPSLSLRVHAPRNPRLSDLIAAKHIWNVSLSALTYRMHRLGLLSDWQYRAFFVELSQLGYRISEPESSDREESQVMQKILLMLEAEGISKTDISSGLQVRPEELEQLIFGLA